MKFRDKLIKINACEEAIEWVGNKGLKKSLFTCERGDWMLWYVSRNIKELRLEDMRLITKAKAKCALLVRHLMKDERSKMALDVAVRFGDSKASRKELDAAATYAAAATAAATYDATYAAAANAAAAYVATYAAAAYAAANAAATVANAAAYAAAAAYAYDAAYVAAKKETLLKCANICREVFKDVIK